MEIDFLLLREISEYCSANDIADVERFVNSLVKIGFNIERYGMKPEFMKAKDPISVPIDIIPHSFYAECGYIPKSNLISVLLKRPQEIIKIVEILKEVEQVKADMEVDIPVKKKRGRPKKVESEGRNEKVEKPIIINKVIETPKENIRPKKRKLS